MYKYIYIYVFRNFAAKRFTPVLIRVTFLWLKIFCILFLLSMYCYVKFLLPNCLRKHEQAKTCSWFNSVTNRFL